MGCLSQERAAQRAPVGLLLHQLCHPRPHQKTQVKTLSISEPAATFTVHFTGVTVNTQILFVGGTAWGKDLKGKGQGKNRLLIDDIKVVEE